jgi:large subunit ribosomal protein L22
VLDLIKGRGVEEALTTAAFTKKRIAPVIHKLLTSAVDNAKYLAGEQGWIWTWTTSTSRTAIANEGPRMKRIRPAPMGRAYRYQRRLTHIILSVAERNGGSNLVTKVASRRRQRSRARSRQSLPRAARRRRRRRRQLQPRSPAAPKKKAARRPRGF